MQIQSDNVLMLAVKSGDLDKLGLLYERYKKRLFGFFYKINGDSQLSEDLIQNVFLKILKHRHTYIGEGSFVSWIFRIARNVSHDHYKKNKNKTNIIKLSPIEYKIEDLNNFEDEINFKEQNIILKSAFEKLSVNKREILILSKYKELSFKEVGEILNCTEGAAKARAHRALNELRKLFLELDKR